MDGHISVIATTGQNAYVPHLRDSLTRAISEQGKLNEEILALDGMSGRKYRFFINNLIGSITNPRYLEIGVFMGSTLCSAIDQNSLRALAIDNWCMVSEAAPTFFQNLARFKKPEAVLSFLDSDFRAVDFSAIGKFNVYLFDGPHSAEDQAQGVTIAMPALDDQFVLIVDDWNWDDVRRGTFDGIRDAGLRLDFAAEIRTTLDNTHPAIAGAASDWHNGYFIAACAKT